MALVKICGIRTDQDAAYINEAKPDFAGFICSQGFRRSITLEKAVALRKQIRAGISTVGVFVNEEIDTVLSFLESGAINVVQLHGNEDNNYIDLLRTYTDAVIVKAFVVKTKEDIETAEKSHADMIILDSGAGTGKEFNQELIGNFPRKYFLAGGMNPGTVAEKIKKLNPFAVDVSSGVETDGVKDRQKVLEFIKQVRES